MTICTFDCWFVCKLQDAFLIAVLCSLSNVFVSFHFYLFIKQFHKNMTDDMNRIDKAG